MGTEFAEGTTAGQGFCGDVAFPLFSDGHGVLFLLFNVPSRLLRVVAAPFFPREPNGLLSFRRPEIPF